MTPTELQARIREHHGTPHRFCRDTGLPRATVYQVLAGRYPGNVERQTARIEAVLDGILPPVLTVESLREALEAVACAVCLRKGRCTRRRAKRCAALYRAQAVAVTRMLELHCEVHHEQTNRA